MNTWPLQAGRAVNISLTLRNWAIGCYIREYEQKGADRATYGENLLSSLSQRLEEGGVEGCASRSLRLYRQFYLTYPEIWQTVSTKSQRGLIPDPIWQILSANFAETIPATIRKSLVSESTAVTTPTIRRSASPELQLPPERLVKSLSFSHFAELIAIDDPLKRTFYEIECIRGNWSVRELKRQIGSLYYERSGLSMDKEKLAELVKAGADQDEPKLAVRDPYIFEFLGLKPREVMRESDLEDALLDKLHDFLLELGHGFCFETRQKRILIGGTHGLVDLVIYHRILKCHVLVELKVEREPPSRRTCLPAATNAAQTGRSWAMGSEWKTMPLGESLEVVIDNRGKTPPFLNLEKTVVCCVIIRSHPMRYIPLS